MKLVWTSLVALSFICPLPSHGQEVAAEAPTKEPETAVEEEDIDPLDALWETLSGAVENLENPERPAVTQRAQVDQFRAGLESFDEAYDPFMKAVPKEDERYWIALLFAAKVANSRPMLGMEPKGTLTGMLKEILASEHAPPLVRSEASAASLIESANGAKESKATIAAWVKKAEAHLAQYPDEPINVKLKAVKELMGPLDLKFKDVEAKDFDLAKLRGKVVLLDFWATWCGPCVAELPNVLATYEKYQPKGFEIVGISLDSTKEKLVEFVKENKMPWVQYFDGKGWENEISGRFGITSIPAMWLLNKEGRVVDMNGRDQLELKVEQLLEE